MWFGVLGLLEVRREDGSGVAISGPARRQVLAALLCRAGATVTAATLIEDLWGTGAPRSAISTLRSHIVRLRADLGRGGDDAVLVTDGAGYRLDVDPEDLDCGLFERLVAEAHRLTGPREAIERFDDALALWRGEPYLEFGDAPFAVLERIRLAELRATARERRTELALEAGLSGELVAELEQRIRAEPFRERNWEQLALALYRADRQADALAACRRARRVLADDLGVEPGPALRALEDRLLRQDPDLLLPEPDEPSRAVVVDRCPYLGLAGYEERDAALFVGRERLTSVLAGRLSDQSVVLVIGASGVGKSSLVRAGLVPALRAGALPGSAAWRVDVCTPATGVLTHPDRRPDLIVLDQAEELFTAVASDERDDLISRLASFTDEDGRLVVVLRGDFYTRLADVETLAPFTQKDAVVIGPMRVDQLRRALVEPAAAAGLRLEDDLIETIMDDVADQPEPLPLLSEAMVRTWQGRRGELLTLEAYRLGGGLAGALEAAAEECYTGLDEPARGAARHLLVRMATRTGTGWVRHAIVRTDGISQDAGEQRALAALIAARLVVANEQRIEITHEALLAHWPRLRDWLEERTLAANLLQHLDQAATEWRTSGRHDTDLYRGARLSAANDWRAEHADDLSPNEEEFLDASSLAAQAELAAARARTRRLRTIVFALAAVVVLAIAGGIVALYERSSAQSEANRADRAALTADARRLAALSVTAPDIATSSLLAVAAYRLQDSPDTRGALLTAVERNQSAQWRMQFANRPQRVVATPDGTRLAVNDNRLRVTIIDPRTRKELAGFPTSGFVYGITADGRQVVTYGPLNARKPTNELAAYDVPSGRTHVIATNGLTDESQSGGPPPAMTSDGRWLALLTKRHVGAGAVVDVLDTREWIAGRHFITAGKPSCVGAGDSALATEQADGSVEVRAVPSLTVIGRLPTQHGSAFTGSNCVAVSPDGSQVARVDSADPRRAVLYRFDGGMASAISLPTQPQPIGTMAFSSDGSQFAVSSESGSLAVYSAADGSQLHSFVGHAGALNGMAWTGVGPSTALYTVGLDGELVSWDLATGPRTVQQSGASHPPANRADLFGSFVVGGAQPPEAPHSARRIFTIDARTGSYASWPAGLIDDGENTEAVAQISASENGTYAAASIELVNGPRAPIDRVAIFDMRTRQHIGDLQLPSGGSGRQEYFAAVSPDGRHAYCNCSPTYDRIDVFALPSGKFLRSFPVDFAGPDAATIEPDPWRFDPAGRLVVFGSDPVGAHQRLGLVNVASGRMGTQTDLGRVDPPGAIAWSHDGHTLALGSPAGTLALYDAATLVARTAPTVVTSGYVQTVSFAPDDAAVVVGGTDGTAQLFNVPDLSPQGQRVPIGNGPVWAWYAPDGDIVGLAQDAAHADSTDERWFRFEAAPRRLVAEACRLAGQDITRAQWRRYLDDRPYQHVCPG